jgi:UDP-2,3-diacylglucosamine hydrolase
VADYFASDVHLRLDHPERGRRLARWVDGLGPDDTLTIVGDLCDFWYASRQFGTDPMACDGLRALAAFQTRGGSLTILTGNHDGWLGPFYERTLGARYVAEPWDVEAHGLRIRLVHGHRLGARPPWKGWMESRRFLDLFRRVPESLARRLDQLLEETNEKLRDAADRRHLAKFRAYADRHADDFDLVVLGHIHRPLDDVEPRPRMIVLGGWHRQSSYLKIDHTGASLIVEPDPEVVACDSAS